jgi:hypothetical protein
MSFANMYLGMYSPFYTYAHPRLSWSDCALGVHFGTWAKFILKGVNGYPLAHT